MTEEITASELELSAEDLKDPAKVTAMAEKIEAENKAAKAANEPSQEDKVLHDQLGRLEKALAARNAKSEEAPTKQETLSELDVDNRVYARTEKLSQARIDVLKEYQALPKNEGKSFEEIAKSSAVQAEFKDLQSAEDAVNELDTNANEEKILESKNEIYDSHVKTGKTPDTEYEHKVSAEKGLEAAGFREY